MSLVNVIHMDVLEHTQAPFHSPISFDITFECCEALPDDLEWKVVYVGSPESNSYDQVLEEVQVGPIPVGLHKFNLQAPCPSLEQIPMEHRLGVTVMLVTASYRQQEFCRIGYYVLNELIPTLQQPLLPLPLEQTGAAAMTHAPLPDNNVTTAIPTPADNIVIVVDDPSMLTRTILADKPRVTRYQIAWQQQQQQDMSDADADKENTATGENAGVLDHEHKLAAGALGEEDIVIDNGSHDHDEDEDDDNMSSSTTSGDSNISMEEPADSPSPPPSSNPSAAFIIPTLSSPNPTHSRLVSPCHDAIRQA